MSEYEERGAYYEVQLNNKQLVFFFMSAVAIAVVIFLCGVMVGRGVKETPLVTGNPVPRSVVASMDDAPLKTEVRRELDFKERLESPRVDETFGASPAPTEGTERQPKAVDRSPAPPNVVTPPRPTPTAPPPTTGAYAVQVVALKTVDSAETLVGKLKTKGYTAYIEPEDASGLYRVRVGRFPARDDAEKIASRLRDEEKFRPYVIQ